ncbi:MAG TPA: RNA polymerase sigma factor [Candidatus Bathyarchaeia archaeon]|nr:RNA polymerase sigma factor [Candidatus Bathyarchaeia archaeon]
MTPQSAARAAAAVWPSEDETSVAETAKTNADNNDLELVVKAKDGDTEAFGELVNRHQRMVYNLAYRFMRDPLLAEDAAQESFIKAFRLLGGFRGDCHFSTWMYRVTASVCLSELDRRKKRAEIELLPAHEKQQAPAGFDKLDMPEIMRQCVRKLPARYANIVTLYYLKEVPYEEIARGMKIPIGTLKTWMYRARAQLRNILEREFKLHGLP